MNLLKRGFRELFDNELFAMFFGFIVSVVKMRSYLLAQVVDIVLC
jgi:hypothetical protein